MSNKEEAKKLTKEIENLLDEGSFQMKEWIYTLDNRDQTKTLSIPSDILETTEKVLGVVGTQYKMISNTKYK